MKSGTNKIIKAFKAAGINYINISSSIYMPETPYLYLAPATHFKLLKELKKIEKKRKAKK